MNKNLFISFPLVFFSAASVLADEVFLDFEGLADSAEISDFYNGGTDSEGASGTDYGVAFGSSLIAKIDSDSGGTGNFANEPSPDTILVLGAAETLIDVESGFDTRVSFRYSSSTSVLVEAWSKLGGTGEVLASLSFSSNYNDNSCVGDPEGVFCNWSLFSMSIPSEVQSIKFTATTAGASGIDDLQFADVKPARRSSIIKLLPLILE